MTHAESPTWDKKIEKNRFVVLISFNDEAVLDKETGVVWERSPSDIEMTLQQASSRCWQLMKGNRFGGGYLRFKN